MSIASIAIIDGVREFELAGDEYKRGLIVRREVKVIVEKHVDGYVAYPLGMKGVVVGAGDTYEETVADVTSAIAFHIETFGSEAFGDEEAVLDAYVTATAVTI